MSINSIVANQDETEKMSDVLVMLMDSFRKTKKDYTVFCVGSDKTTGDAIAPFVGTLLKEKNINVVGTVYSPIDQKIDYLETLKTINNPVIIVSYAFRSVENPSNARNNKERRSDTEGKIEIESITSRDDLYLSVPFGSLRISYLIGDERRPENSRNAALKNVEPGEVLRAAQSIAKVIEEAFKKF